MAEDDKQALIAFEEEADRRVQALPIGEMPVRAFWTLYHSTVFRLLHVQSLQNRDAWVTGETLVSRVSYIIPWLRNRRVEPTGASAIDAFEAIVDYPDGLAQIANLTLYMHFCEVMPDVHRGLLEVERTPAGAFRLDHPHPDQARAEAIDILVSELALNHNPVPENRPPHVEAFVLADGSPHWDMASLVRLVRTMAAEYRAGMIEHPLISENGLQAVFGFDGATYRDVQAAIFGFADAIQQVATILSIRGVEGGREDRAVLAEALEWMSVYWRGETFSEIVSAVAGVDQAAVGRFVDAFSLDYDQPAPQWEGGEGYSPPFIRLAGARLFSPDFIKRFAHARNVLITLDRNDDPRFDNLVSGDLEPVLLGELEEVFATVPGLRVYPNCTYDGGELDMVVISADETHVVVIEAKAPLPPQGVRATARLADRMREGLRQIARFKALSRVQQLGHLRRASRLALENPTIEFWLAGRSCFGAREVWLPGAAVRPVTLPLLRLAVQGADGMPPNLDQLGLRTAELVEEMLRDLGWHWDYARIELFGQTLETPQLVYDRARAAAWRIRAGGAPGRGAAI